MIPAKARNLQLILDRYKNSKEQIKWLSWLTGALRGVAYPVIKERQGSRGRVLQTDRQNVTKTAGVMRFHSRLSYSHQRRGDVVVEWRGYYGDPSPECSGSWNEPMNQVFTHSLFHDLDLTFTCLLVKKRLLGKLAEYIFLECFWKIYISTYKH